MRRGSCYLSELFANVFLFGGDKGSLSFEFSHKFDEFFTGRHDASMKEKEEVDEAHAYVISFHHQRHERKKKKRLAFSLDVLVRRKHNNKKRRKRERGRDGKQTDQKEEYVRKKRKNTSA